MLPQVPSELIVEVYRDLFQPALRQFGVAGESVAKTICLLNLPFVYGAARYEQLLERVKKSFQKVPEANLTSPPANAVFQIAERLMSMPEDDAISEMYLELLSSCINKEHVKSVHPAFVNLISQISGDEALFIDCLAQNERSIYVRKDNSWAVPTRSEIDQLLIPWSGSMIDGKLTQSVVVYPDIFNASEYFFTYIEHLHSLGIIEYVHGPEYQITKEFIEAIKGYGHWYISLSKFGQLFYNVCIKNSDAKKHAL